MTQTELFENKTDCCGCGACEEICPAGAIRMREDRFGALYPQVDEEICLHCGQCTARCGFRHAQRSEAAQVYAAVSVSEPPETSASGGVAASLSARFLERGGVVYGCAMQTVNGELTPKHIRVQSPDELPLLKGSKYVQSDLRDCFSAIKTDLQSKREVLLIGTPCQVAAVKGYLGGDCGTLYTAELICHGVPSQKTFHRFTRYLEAKRGGKLVGLQFRCKNEKGERFATLTFASDGGELRQERFSPDELSYYRLFLDGALQRENCYSCPFAGRKRAGDITMGDYWGLAQVHPELLVQNGGGLDERKGVSCLLVNTERGGELLERYGDGVLRFPSDYEKAARYNGQLARPTARPKERETVFRLLGTGYDALERWYRKRLRKATFRRRVRALGKRILRR